MSMGPKWKLAEPDGNVQVVRMIATGVGWKQWYLKLADVHFDSVFCDRHLFKSLLDEARERDAPIAIYGDFVDVMQGKSDKRSDTGELRKEYVGIPGIKYLDAVVEDCVSFIEPYVPWIQFISDGNHGQSVASHTEHDVVVNICRILGVQHMRYSGWVKYQGKKDTGGHKWSRVEYFHHGSGGDSPVTLGMIGTNRRQASYVADIYVSGHNHNEFTANRPYAMVSNSGRELVVDTLHINIPSLKDEWSSHGGFHTVTGKPPKPIGGCWMYFEHHPRTRNKINVEAIRAR